MRRRSGRLGGKGAPGSARSAILNFLAAAEPQELAPLLFLFMQPLSKCFSTTAPNASNDGFRYMRRTLRMEYEESCDGHMPLHCGDDCHAQ